MAREIITPSKEFVENFIQGFSADAKPYTYRSSAKSKEKTAAGQPDFDVNSINLNIYGDEDDDEKQNLEEGAEVTDAVKVTETTVAAKAVDAPVEKSTTEPKSAQADESPPTVKTTRISAKMRRATRAEFCAAYFGKVNTKGGKPIAILPTIMDRLYRLCTLSGDRHACPTYIINNLLSEFLDAVEPESKRWGALD